MPTHQFSATFVTLLTGKFIRICIPTTAIVTVQKIPVRRMSFCTNISNNLLTSNEIPSLS